MISVFVQFVQNLENWPNSAQWAEFRPVCKVSGQSTDVNSSIPFCGQTGQNSDFVN